MAKKYIKCLDNLILDLGLTLINQGIEDFEYELLRAVHYKQLTQSSAKKIKFIILSGEVGKRSLFQQLEGYNQEKNLFKRTVLLNKLSSFYGIGKGRLMILAEEIRHGKLYEFEINEDEKDEEAYFY